MTIWVLRQELDVQDEEQIFTRKDLVLPFGQLPDLSQLSDKRQAERLLKTLHPDEPPESIRRRVERFWHQFNDLQMEDLIAVPLAHSQAVVLANVSGHYHYEVGAQGSDIHLIPVSWYEKRIPISKFGKHKAIFDPSNPPMSEVTAQDARVAIRDHLPHSYNRFARMKWLLVIFFAMSLIRMFVRLDK